MSTNDEIKKELRIALTPEIFDQFYQLRALAMSADALINENSASDADIAVSHVLRILMEKAEAFANMYTEYPTDGGAA